MATGHLREGDADRMVDLAARDYSADPGPGMPWELLHGLLALIPCDVVSYQHHEIVGGRTPLAQEVCEGDVEYEDSDDGTSPVSQRFWELFWISGCSWPQRTGDLVTVRMLRDEVPSRRERDRDPVMREILFDVKDKITVSLPAPPGEARRIIFFQNEGQMFSERDRQVLTLLRPHLVENQQAATRRHRGVPELTPREWQIITLTSHGLSAAEIAEMLVLSTATVRKHLENIRTRLGVHSAVAAAAIALPHAPAAATRMREPSR